eukprot:GHRR01021988.1.p1 GENE.GHRR01021988.1~~GHRR01021988.1.p1  ORF type:complete len:353 (+),score=105.84 GHRR01021988.1:292-1350(+)
MLPLPAAIMGAAGDLSSSSGWGTANVPAVAIGALSAAAIALAVFLSADADLGLLLRRCKPGAFKGKVVWVTGASQGLGEVLAKYLAAQGAKLILSSRTTDKLQRVKAACQTAPANVIVLPFDLLDGPEKLGAVVQAADAAFGGAGIDYLVHNAGASQHALAAETTAEVAQKLLDINTLAPIKLTQAVLPYMIKRHKGRLVVVASMAAKVPSPGQAVYSAAKMAVWGYFASVATEVADKGISVTICCPGPVATGTRDAPRMIYGPTGPIQRIQKNDSKRMDTERAAYLIAKAMAAGVPECWLARQPVLTMAYLMQYLPTLGWLVLKKIGPSRARAVSGGKDGYNVTGFLSKQD